MKFKRRGRMSVWRYLTLGYLIVILLGSVLLVLPFSAREGQTTSYLDALFTSVSATCVTGLVPFDTNLHWSGFGQVVILLLIQTGGLGFMTFVTVVFVMLRKNLGLYEKTAIMQTVGGRQFNGLKTLVLRVVVGSLLLETLGACLLSVRFIADFGAGKGIWYAVFHSVSAFCNAGFDLMGGCFSQEGSLSHYATDPLVSLTVCFLIIFGGLGFCVWGDVLDRRGNLKKCTFYTKLVLIATGSILFCSILLFLLFERNNPTQEGLNFGERLLVAVFNATTARTAGFYATNPVSYSESGYLLNLLLMTVGGCSGSTAGGIKVSSFVVLLVGMGAQLRGKRDITMGKKRLDFSLVGQAYSLLIAYLTMVLLSVMLICAVEADVGFKEALFECISAIGTVGQTMELTPRLGVFAKIILMILMYAGRVGVITLLSALRAPRVEAQVRRPVESIYVG